MDKPVYVNNRYENLPADAQILALPGENIYDHNIYIPSYGYLTDHIPARHQRGRPEHWDQQYAAPDQFEISWKMKSGPLQFVQKITERSDDIVTVINLGAGLGDLSCGLARIQGVHVYHVDFSSEGNKVAREKFCKENLLDSVSVITEDNNLFLEDFISKRNRADVVFLYGASGSNEPSDIEYQKTLELCVKALKGGGFLWSVGMIQPRLSDDSNTQVADILGDFPKAPGLAARILENAGMVLVGERVEDRPDYHPIIAGGPAVHHTHRVARALYRKETKGESSLAVPEFEF